MGYQAAYANDVYSEEHLAEQTVVELNYMKQKSSCNLIEYSPGRLLPHFSNEPQPNVAADGDALRAPRR